MLQQQILVFYRTKQYMYKIIYSNKKSIINIRNFVIPTLMRRLALNP